MRKCALVLLLCLLAQSDEALAQFQVRGQVRDAESLSALPGATVQVDGALRGAVTDENGRFVISAPAIPAILLVRHIGYETRRVEIDTIEARDVTVDLERVAVEMEELIVSGEDPAVEIMRRVLARKRAFRAEYESSYAEVYTRFWLFREFEAIQVIESVRASYWRKDDGVREIVRARRVRPDGGGTFRFAGPGHAPNFYDDTVTLQGTTYATPLHPNALEIYVFRLGGRRMLDETIVWDIYFTPRRAATSAFIGHAAVVDSVFDVRVLELRPQPATVVTPPVEQHDVRYTQRFVRHANGVVLPADFQADGYLAFGRLGVAYPAARYEQVSGISNYALDVPTPDSLFSDGQRQWDHPLVDRSAFLFVDNPTVLPMTPRETENLLGLNPRMTVERAFRPEGLLAGYTAVRTTEREKPEEPAGGLVGMAVRNAWLWYNRVDGWLVGLSHEREVAGLIEMEARAGYAVDQERLYAGVDLSAPWRASGLSGSVFAGALSQSVAVNSGSRYSRFLAGMLTYIGYDDYFDYYREDGVRFGASAGPSAIPIQVSLSAALENHTSLKKESGFNGWLFRNVQSENPQVDEGRISAIRVGLAFGRPEAGVRVDLEKGVSGVLGSDFDFEIVSGAVRFQLATIHSRRDRPNTLLLSVFGGTSAGSPPLQRALHVDGAPGFHAERLALRTVQSRSTASRHAAGLFWEHDFTTVPMELLGLWGLADSGIGIVLFGGHAIVRDIVSPPEVFEADGSVRGNAAAGDTELEEANRSDLESGTDRWFHEMGIGLTYPFRLPFRIDFTAGLDRNVYSLTLGLMRS